MALGVNYETGEGGDIIPAVKYDSRAGRVIRVDREGSENNNVDITSNFSAVFDFENIEIGTIWFRDKAAPDFKVAPIGQKAPAPPSGDYKPGVRLMVKLGKACGGDARELASTAKAFLRGLDALHDAYLEGVKANPGKLPVVKLKATTPVTTEGGGKKSTNYVPNFEISSWVARPANFEVTLRSTSTGHAAASGPASTGSSKMDTSAADEDDFG